jgi:hypothetical protein
MHQIVHTQHRCADGQQHRPLHQSSRTDGSHRKRRRGNGPSATAQAASGTADHTPDTADHTIDSRITDRPSRRDARISCATRDTQCVSENIHLGSSLMPDRFRQCSVGYPPIPCIYLLFD